MIARAETSTVFPRVQLPLQGLFADLRVQHGTKIGFGRLARSLLFTGPATGAPELGDSHGACHDELSVRGATPGAHFIPPDAQIDLHRLRKAPPSALHNPSRC